LATIKGLKGEVLSPKIVSTHRLNQVEKSTYSGKPGEAQFSYSNQWEAEPTKLTELDSALLERPSSRARTSDSRDRRQEKYVPNTALNDFLGSEGLESTISFYEEFANAQEFSGSLDAFNSNLLPIDQMNGFFPNEIYEDDSLSRDSDYMKYRSDFKNFDEFSMFDIEMISGIQNPSKELQVAAAIVIVLVADDKTVPSDLSWNFFREIASTMDIATVLNSLSPEVTPAFKIRAVKPFLNKLDSKRIAEIQVEGNLNISLSSAVSKLVKWCKYMIEAPDRKSLVKNSSISPSKDGSSKKVVTIATSKKENSNKSLQAISQKTTMIDDSSSKKVSKMPQNARVPKLEPELYPIYSEILTDVYEHPVLVTILVAANEPVTSTTNFKEWDPLNLLGKLTNIIFINIIY